MRAIELLGTRVAPNVKKALVVAAQSMPADSLDKQISDGNVATTNL